MSYTVRGFQGVTLVKRAPQYNAENRIYSYRTEYQGTVEAIRGLELQLVMQGLSYQTDHAGPVWSLFLDEPVLEDVTEELDRWEIFTESTEKSLFDLPTVIAQAYTYDLTVAAGENSWRQEIERLVSSPDPASLVMTYPLAIKILNHLKAGVTGWQLDLVGLRRTRRMPAYQASSFRISLDDGLYIYTTGQLGVPGTVAFGLPITPTSITIPYPTGDTTTLFRWGWRKRSQRVEIIGTMAEQTVELIFAPWSTLAYSDAPNSLAWT